MFWFLYLCNLMVWKFDTLKLRWLDPTEFLVWNYLSSTSLGCKYIRITKQSLWQRLEFHYNIWTKPNLATSSTGHPGVPWRPCTLKIWKILVVKLIKNSWRAITSSLKASMKSFESMGLHILLWRQSLQHPTSMGSHPFLMLGVKVYYSERVRVHTLCEWYMSKSTTVNEYGFTPFANGGCQSLLQSTGMGWRPLLMVDIKV